MQPWKKLNRSHGDKLGHSGPQGRFPIWLMVVHRTVSQRFTRSNPPGIRCVQASKGLDTAGPGHQERGQSETSWTHHVTSRWFGLTGLYTKIILINPNINKLPRRNNCRKTRLLLEVEFVNDRRQLIDY